MEKLTPLHKRGLIAVAACMLIACFFMMMGQNQPIAVRYFPVFKNLITEKKLTEVTIIKDGLTTGTLRSDAETKITDKNDQSFTVKGRQVQTPTPSDHKLTGLTELLESSGVKYSFAKDNSGAYSNWIIYALLFVGLFILPIFLMRRMGNQSREAGPFTKNRAKLWSEDQREAHFSDLAGMPEVVIEVKELVEFLKGPDKFTRMGAKIPKGALFVGGPGCGKTLLARALAREAGVPFFYISGSSFVEMFVGVGASRVRSLFDEAKKRAPSIIFIDEIDAVGRHRGTGLGGGHDEREQTLNQLLVEMDGFEENSGVIVIAATNRENLLDPALTRRGRFDRRVDFPDPDKKGRLEILQLHAKGKPLQNPDDLQEIAAESYGKSGSDLAGIMNEAAIIAARRGKDTIGRDELREGQDRVEMSQDRGSQKLGEKPKRLVSFHEAGHALVCKILSRDDQNSPFATVGKVTIVGRGRAGGYTRNITDEEAVTMRVSQLKVHMAVYMGGMVAEELEFGEHSAGASNDLEMVTSIAEKMVTAWGMSEVVGPLAFKKSQGGPFLGKKMSFDSDKFGDKTQQNIDDEMKKLALEAVERAKKTLQDYLPALKSTANLLFEKETIDGSDLDPFIVECDRNRS